MSNQYTEFSQVVENLTEAEISWLRSGLERSEQEEEGDDNQIIYATVVETNLLRGADSKPYLWIQGEYGLNEATIKFLQTFLQTFRPDEVIGIEQAIYADRPRAGEFGGSATFITAKTITGFSTTEWLEQQHQHFEAKTGTELEF
jgi:hypothetical protein